MSNFKGWTSENLEAIEQRQLSDRLDAMTTGAAYAAKCKAENAPKAKTAQPKRKKNPEWEIQSEFVRRMEQKYPLVMVFSDTAAHIFKTKLQQIRANKLQSKLSKDWPDVFVAQPSGEYAGLFLEFKAESPYYVHNPCALKKDEHVEDQYQTMKRLSERGYYWSFVWSVEQGMEIVEKYLNL